MPNLDLPTILSFFLAMVVAPLVTQRVKRKRWDNNAIRALCVGLGGVTGLLAWGVALVQWAVTGTPVDSPAPEALEMIGAGLAAGLAATGGIAGWKNRDALAKMVGAKPRRRTKR